MATALVTSFEAVTAVFRRVLTTLNIQPESYRFLFPAGKDAATIRKLVAQGIFPTIPHLAPAITWCIFLSVIRYIVQLSLLKPLALRAMKLSFTPLVLNSDIDKCFPNLSKKKYEDSEIKQKCEQAQLNVETVYKYLWVRKKNLLVSKKVVKFMEAFWRFLMYAVFCAIGYYTLFIPTVAPWILDTNQHWDKWPSHQITSTVEFYYHVQLGCYLHQLLWTEVSRSDALEMILHHLTTILLLIFSFITNHTRVGSSILLLHDSSDVFLESAKVFNYTSKAKGHGWAKFCCDVAFACFALTFLATRLIIYPRYIIFSVFFEAPNHFGVNWAGFWVFSVLLVVLQILHIFWFYLIAKMIHRLVSTGIEKDERSDDEEEVGDDDCPVPGNNNSMSSNNNKNNLSRQHENDNSNSSSRNTPSKKKQT